MYKYRYEVKTIKEQVDILNEQLSLNIAPKNTLPEYNDRAEGFFVIPCQKLISDLYTDAIKIVLEKIEKVTKSKISKFLDIDRILTKRKSKETFILQVQMGLNYRGMSVVDAERSFDKNEYGLNMLEVSIILLTHPEILIDKDNNLWIDCPSDIFEEDHSPTFEFYKNEIQVGYGKRNIPYPFYGSATFFTSL